MRVVFATHQDEIRAMRWPDLLKAAKEYDDLIHGQNPCFSTSDICYLAMLEEEIDRRRELNGCPHFW
jgi:hypothetical protein